ncbi:WD40 repeat domain-containing protein [Nonomuraea wenchangensis]
MAHHVDYVRPDGRTLTGFGHDPMVLLWDVAHRTLRGRLTGHLFNIAFSPDGRTLAGASSRHILLWHSAGRTLSAVQDDPSPQVNALAFGPDGRTLATVGLPSVVAGSAVALWRDGRVIARLDGHTGPVLDAVFSPDGRTLASAAADQAVILWQTDARRSAQHICGVLIRSLAEAQWRQNVPG